MNDTTVASKEGIVLVTGATGFIGTHLCNRLLEKGYRVRALLRGDSDGETLPGQIEIVRCEFSDKEGLLEACEGASKIFHLAGVAHVRNSAATLYHETNVIGTRQMLDAGCAAKVSKFVFFSSILAEKQESEYGRSKWQAEQLVLDHASHYQSLTILRPVNVYGVGMKGNIVGLIRRIRKGSLPPLPRLNNKLSLVGATDLCEAAILAAEDSTSGVQIYPVTDDQAYTPNSLERAIYVALGKRKPDWHCPRVIFYAAALGAQILNTVGIWNNDLGLRTYRNLVDNNEYSCEKITAGLNYRPTRTLSDELPAIIGAIASD